MELFYEQSISMFKAFLEADGHFELSQDNACIRSKQTEFNRVLDDSKGLAVQLITKCAADHNFKFRMFALKHGLIEAVLNCQRHKSKVLNLHIAKFFKQIIKQKDNVFYQYVMKKQLFLKFFELYEDNQNKGNLLHSIIMDLFDHLFVREFNDRLSKHVMELVGDKMRRD